MKILKNLFIFAVVVALSKAEDFDYRYQSKWYDFDDAECDLDRQSPIELNSHESVLRYDIPPILFHNYNVSYTQPSILSNNGHSANLQFPNANGYLASISGGPLYENKYLTESLHFHWGSQDAHGSEHVVDSERFSLEMHIVHRNSKYESVNEAAQHEDGLSVLGIFYNVDPNQQSPFTGLNKIVDALSSITEYEASTEIENFLLSDLFGDINTDNFFTYPGSLTTPPCSQAVTWIVFPEVIHISHDQMSRFRLLIDSHGELMVNNYRCLQAKGKRQVYLSRSKDVALNIQNYYRF